MIKKKSWKEFRDTGMLWVANRILHLFGWAICYDYNGKKLKEVFPARVKFRGFAGKLETEGFIKISKYLKKNINQIKEEAES